MEKMIEEFKAFMVDSLSDGTFTNLDDINTLDAKLQVLKDGMETFVNLYHE